MDHHDMFMMMKGYAANNPHGSLKAVAPWAGSSPEGIPPDIIQDIKNSLSHLNNIPQKILMSSNTYKHFVSNISFRVFYHMGAIFGCAPDNRSWIEVNDQYDDDCVIVLARGQYDNMGNCNQLATIIDIR